MENPKTQNKKESKPIQKKKNSIKSNISHPNLKKREKNVPEPVPTI